MTAVGGHLNGLSRQLCVSGGIEQQHQMQWCGPGRVTVRERAGVHAHRLTERIKVPLVQQVVPGALLQSGLRLLQYLICVRRFGIRPKIRETDAQAPRPTQRPLGPVLVFHGSPQGCHPKQAGADLPKSAKGVVVVLWWVVVGRSSVGRLGARHIRGVWDVREAMRKQTARPQGTVSGTAAAHIRWQTEARISGGRR